MQELIGTISVGDTVKIINNDWAKGVAFAVLRNDYQDVFIEDPELDEEFGYVEEIVIPDRWVCVMVGDDRPFVFDEQDIVLIEENQYCRNCGQIGCNH